MKNGNSYQMDFETVHKSPLEESSEGGGDQWRRQTLMMGGATHEVLIPPQFNPQVCGNFRFM